MTAKRNRRLIPAQMNRRCPAHQAEKGVIWRLCEGYSGRTVAGFRCIWLPGFAPGWYYQVKDRLTYDFY